VESPARKMVGVASFLIMGSSPPSPLVDEEDWVVVVVPMPKNSSNEQDVAKIIAARMSANSLR
jgi:hypothetical protein